MKKVCLIWFTVLCLVNCPLCTVLAAPAGDTAYLPRQDEELLDSLILLLEKRLSALKSRRADILGADEDTHSQQISALGDTIVQLDSLARVYMIAREHFRALDQMDSLLHGETVLPVLTDRPWVEATEVSAWVEHVKKLEETFDILASTGPALAELMPGVFSQPNADRWLGLLRKTSKLVGKVTELEDIVEAYEPLFAPPLRDTSEIPIKTWDQYTSAEQLRLVARWGDTNVQAILEILRHDLADHELTARMLAHCSYFLGLGFDLRGIQLNGVDLRDVRLSQMYLQGADLSQTNLEGTNLRKGRLPAANLSGANVQEAILSYADLRGADLHGCNLRNANLRYADMAATNLKGANLCRCDLSGANVKNANLFNATLDSTFVFQLDLGEARNLRYVIWGDQGESRYTIGEEVDIDSISELIDRSRLLIASLQDGLDSYQRIIDELNSELDSAELAIAPLQTSEADSATDADSPALITKSLLARRDSLQALKEHCEARSCSTQMLLDWLVGGRRKQILFGLQGFYRRAEITYRDLQDFYRKESLNEVADEFNFRENEVITRRLLRSPSQPLEYLVGLSRVVFLKWTYGYGSRPTRLILYSLTVVLLFTIAFTLLTIAKGMRSGVYLVKPDIRQAEEILSFRKGHLLLDSLYFSLLSFSTFGYGALRPRQWLQFFRLEPVEYKPVRWARILVGIEAALGIWVFALLVTVLFGKS